MLPSPRGAEPITTVVVMSCRNARFRPPGNRRGDNHELPLVRSCRVHRRCVDHSCVSAPAIGETPKFVPKVFIAKRSGSTVDNHFAYFRLQFVSVHRGGVLVFDQFGRAMEITQCQKGFEIWLAMATRNVRECASGDVRLKTGRRSRINPVRSAQQDFAVIEKQQTTPGRPLRHLRKPRPLGH